MRRSAWMLSAAAILVPALPAVPAHAQTCPGADARPTRSRPAATGRATLCLVNARRARAGLPRLRANPHLRRAATRYSRDMVRRHYFGHVSPRGATMLRRVVAAGYRTAGRRFQVAENLGYATGARATPRRTVRAWMASPGHRANILSPGLREGGVGVALGAPFGGGGGTWTLDFGRRSRP